MCHETWQGAIGPARSEKRWIYAWTVQNSLHEFNISYTVRPLVIIIKWFILEMTKNCTLVVTVYSSNQILNSHSVMWAIHRKYQAGISDVMNSKNATNCPTCTFQMRQQVIFLSHISESQLRGFIVYIQTLMNEIVEQLMWVILPLRYAKHHFNSLYSCSRRAYQS